MSSDEYGGGRPGRAGPQLESSATSWESSDSSSLPAGDRDQATVTHRAHPQADSSVDALVTRRVSDGSNTLIEGRERFRILRAYARGGLGQIFVAHDQQLGREVALKEIQPALADDPSSQGRFVLEAEVTGNLEHPGFVPVYALGRYEDGRPFYAMRLIRGQSLKEAIAARNSSEGKESKGADTRALRSLLSRICDVCNAMAYAHSRGVIHRDLKPANILLGPYGETVVVDWGLAKVLTREPRQGGFENRVGPSGPVEATVELGATSTQQLGATQTDAEPGHVGGGAETHDRAQHPGLLETRTASGFDSANAPTLAGPAPALMPPSGSDEGHTLPGRAVGTPAYMSPEQAAGETRLLGPTTDIYSLGSTLYCVLTGRAPFGDSDAVPTVLAQVQAGEFLRPRAVAPKVPKPLEAICLKAMARRPEDRYSSMTALAEDLDSFLADEPVSAHREAWPSRIARWSRRHKSWALGVVATLLAILTVLGVTADTFRRSALRERSAREHGLRVAAKFAARTVAAEIDRRWRILEDEVDEPYFLSLFQQAMDKPLESPERRALQLWLVNRFGTHQRYAAAANWFLTDDRGNQIARAPVIEKSLGVNYAFRDYFNGLGRDLPEGTLNLAPIKRAHRSIVFQSKNTGRYIVVFSVPVRLMNLQDPSFPKGETNEVVGVLGMAVDVGRFGVLQLDVGNEQIAVLADLRPDDTGRRGLVLHHPGLAMSETKQAMAYLSPPRVESLDNLRAEALRRYRERRRSELEPTEPARLLSGSYSQNYRDPIGGDYSGRWLAAFEPVVIEGRPDQIDDTGWVVIVQERESERDR